MKPVILVYLHGFNSSPASYKARLLYQSMRDRFGGSGIERHLVIPDIPPPPGAAIKMLSGQVARLQREYTVALAGSSLGGFYATWLAERFGSRAVLINPAVRPHELLSQYLGENINYYTSERWILERTHIQQFRDLDIDPITRPARYLLMLQKGDETLDYRQAADKYRDCPAIIEDDGDHSFVGFERHIDKLLEFCGFHA